jgi:hypothetical protein
MTNVGDPECGLVRLVEADSPASVRGLKDREAYRLEGDAEDLSGGGRVIDAEDGHWRPGSATAGFPGLDASLRPTLTLSATERPLQPVVRR